MKTILVVEDDNDINALVTELLRRDGYAVTQAWSGTEAIMHLEKRKFSLIVLDLMLPGMAGEEIIQQLRKADSAPVIVLSAKEMPQIKAMVLRMGADDYMTKPFDAEEFLARVDCVLRRSRQGVISAILHHHDIELDQDARTVTRAGTPLSLTAREFDILALLMSNPHKVFTKENIFQSVWGEAFYAEDNTVNVHVSNLRAKLGEKNYIQTVWGIGFKLSE